MKVQFHAGIRGTNETLRFVCPKCTRETDGIVAKNLRCGTASAQNRKRETVETLKTPRNFLGQKRPRESKHQGKEDQWSISGPPGPKPRKSLEKVWKKSGKASKGPEKLFRDFFQTLRRSRAPQRKITPKLYSSQTRLHAYILFSEY